MGKIKQFFGMENRADTSVTVDDTLLAVLLSNITIDRDKAKQIPSVASAISLISSIISSTPIRLYKCEGDKITPVENDVRVRLLNDETGDTLNANDMWKAVIEDYFLGKGAYIYINRKGNTVKSINYVEDKYISIIEGTDKIFKDFEIQVNGTPYYPYDFIKILRNSKNGAYGTPIVEENNMILQVAYAALVYEYATNIKGGSKKGFLKSKSKLTNEAMISLREAYAKLYGNGTESVVVLNEGMEFQDAGSTSMEMQLNESKAANSSEIGKIFHVSTSLMSGNSTTKPEEEMQKFVKLACISVMKDIECALNKDFLLEKEKQVNVKKGPYYYYAYDTKELLKGSFNDRMAGYKDAISSKAMTIDEVRYMEDLEPLGLDFINLGLADVLYNPKTKEVYTPNTNQTVKLDDLQKGGVNDESGNTEQLSTN